MAVMAVVAAHMVLFIGLLIRGSQHNADAAGTALRDLLQGPGATVSSATTTPTGSGAVAQALPVALAMAASIGAESNPAQNPRLSTPDDSTPSASVVYVVRQGDTLSKIAKANHTSVKAIRLASGLSSDALAVGQKVRFPVE
jgi:LysM repeat protein